MFKFMKPNRSGDADGEPVFPARDKILAAVFYGVSSLAVIFFNKAVMSEFNFPFFDFLAFFQFTITSIILLILTWFKRIEIPLLNTGIFYEVFPISLMFLGNVICGLGGTRSLNLPMFTALRRFSIFMTMLAEYFVLGREPSYPVLISVLMMVGGAMVAAIYDLEFDASGYLLVFFNNFFTTLNGVWMKKASMSGRCNKLGILFYNSLFSALIMLVFFVCEHSYYSSISVLSSAHTTLPMASSSRVRSGTGARLLLEALTSSASTVSGAPNAVFASTNLPVASNAEHPASQYYIPSTIFRVIRHEGWNNPNFLVLFFLASAMGSVLNYSIFLCTTLNSALTTAVIGCLKNVLTTYVGMVAFSDYSFHVVNFVGLNISILGSLYYTYITMFKGLAGFGGG